MARWDLFWADLDPAVGSEQGGESRPVLVVSNNGFNNARFAVVTVLPCTKLAGKKRAVYPFEVVLPNGMVTAEHESIVMPQQIRTISRKRLLTKIGAITDHAMRATIENRMLEHLDIAFEAESLE